MMAGCSTTEMARDGMGSHCVAWLVPFEAGVCPVSMLPCTCDDDFQTSGGKDWIGVTDAEMGGGCARRVSPYAAESNTVNETLSARIRRRSFLYSDRDVVMAHFWRKQIRSCVDVRYRENALF